MKIYLDFDGTVVEHDYPKIGRYNPGSLELVKELYDKGYELILNTYRIECLDNSFNEAMDYISKYNINISSYTKTKYNPKPFNIEEILNDKIIYIDDISYGIPLRNAVVTNGKMVDFVKLREIFKEYNII